MRVLGVDPGSRLTGWGLLEINGARSTLIDAGVLSVGDSSCPLPRRLGRLYRELLDLVERGRPQVAAVETPFHGVNSRDALRLAHARGVILAVLDHQQIELAEYAPAAVKKAVTGSGRASKEQVRAMVGRLLATSLADQSFDVTDALAVALCHAGQAGMQAAVARATTR